MKYSGKIQLAPEWYRFGKENYKQSYKESEITNDQEMTRKKNLIEIWYVNY